MSDVKGKKVALVGGAGFIGHNLALRLKELGAEVEIIDGLSVNNLLRFTSTKDHIPNRNLYLQMLNDRLELIREADIPLHVQDVRDYYLVSKVLSGIKPDTIVMLAAVAHANVSNKDPFSTFDHSMRTLENCLDFSRNDCPHFIYFSSSMVYGHFTEGVVDEDSPCNPLGIYGALKFSGEKLVIGYNQVFGMPYTIIRPSALYGQRCVSRRVGQVFIENALNKQDLTISGDGSDGLDFTYIDDVVQGVVKSIASPKSHNQIFNITYGSSRPVGEMAEMVVEHFPGIQVHYEPKDKLMPDRGTLSVDKAKELIGYEPAWPLEKGFIKYINWYKQFQQECPNLFAG